MRAVKEKKARTVLGETTSTAISLGAICLRYTLRITALVVWYTSCLQRARFEAEQGAQRRAMHWVQRGPVAVRTLAGRLWSGPLERAHWQDGAAGGAAQERRPLRPPRVRRLEHAAVH